MKDAAKVDDVCQQLLDIRWFCEYYFSSVLTLGNPISCGLWCQKHHQQEPVTVSVHSA
jgi:hypothetical protein